ncbi:hypothetical protein [Kitasatospora camelliae]|uniref:Uncharacterized protein n=1 Tax=Kitasatospora camelliae TaxID=3156397 RepID=A0AAU8K875_9ACTN
MDVEIAPSNINNVRLKLKRLAERGILVETEQGLFTLPRPQPLRRAATSLLSPTERPNRASPQMPPLGALGRADERTHLPARRETRCE